MAYNTIVGSTFRNRSWDTSLRLEINISQNTFWNYTDVSWAVIFGGTARRYPWNIYVNGAWGLRVGDHVEWPGRRSLWCSNGGQTVVSNGCSRVMHDGNGNAAVHVYFQSSLHKYAYDGATDFWLGLPHIDRSPASVSLGVAGVTSNSITYQLHTNYPADFVFDGVHNHSSLTGWNSTANITKSNLAPNTEYCPRITRVYNRYNNVTTDVNTGVSYHTNGIAPDTRNRNCTYFSTSNSIKINSPTYHGSCISSNWAYTLDSDPVWHNLPSSGIISGLKPDETYRVSTRYQYSYYLNNSIVSRNIYLLQNTEIRTKFLRPCFRMHVSNPSTTLIKVELSAIRASGYAEGYSYYVVATSPSDGHILPFTKEYSSSYVFQFAGIAGNEYKITAIAKNSDGETSRMTEASIICGATTAPILSSTTNITSYITTADIVGATCTFFSKGTIKAEVISSGVTAQTKVLVANAPIGKNDIPCHLDNLVPNNRYTVKIVARDQYGHISSQVYDVTTWPKAPELKNGINLVDKPKAKSVSLSWEPVEGRYYSQNLTYVGTYTCDKDGTKSFSTLNPWIKLTPLRPETVYTIQITPEDSNYAYQAADIHSYTIKIRTIADTWLKLHRTSDTNDTLYNRYKVYLINETYPSGLELRKPGIKVIK